MGERSIVKWKGHEVELYIERRGDRCLVLNPSNGVWKIYNGSSISCGCANEFDYEMLTQLDKDGLFSDIVEYADIEHTDEFRLLILEVTKSCNLACTYCFEGDKPKVYSTMSLKTALKAFELFADISTFKTIMVEFNGGEALLNFDLIRQAVPEIRKAAMDKQIEVKFTLQSNGTTLTEEIVEFLVREDIPIGISIDGHQEYNCNRKYKNGEAIDGKLIDNINLLKERGVKFSTLSVLSMKKQYEDIYRLQKELGNSTCRINLLNNVGNGSANKIGEELIADLADEFMDFATKATEDSDALYESNLIYHLMGLLLYTPFMCYKTPCGTGYNQLYVNAEGEIYACQEACYVSKGFLGNVDDGAECVKRRIDADEWIKSAAMYKEQTPCVKCVWRKLCHVCPADYLNDNTSCEFNRRVIPELLWFLNSNQERLLNYIRYQ